MPPVASTFTGTLTSGTIKAAEITGFTKEEAFDCNLVEAFVVPYMQDSVSEVFESALRSRATVEISK